jgi:hypothetical protein
VQDLDDIKNVICSIFKDYPLQTNKRLDFNDFYEAVNLKNKGKTLNKDETEKIIKLKINMNLKRTISDQTLYLKNENSVININ